MTEHFSRAKPDDGWKQSRGWTCKTWAGNVYKDAGTRASVLWHKRLSRVMECHSETVSPDDDDDDTFW